ncbi:MAG: FtsW/RodA/SpoVE family cell cycle protein, partial [Myxococcales bacterium]|nr:FtsW/RodA/SpoVE family cell cycle protein [Myxococcales bacterium]
LALPSAVGTALGAIFVLLHPYALRRWVGFMDPWAVANSEGFQLVQSFVAFARGGPLGVGLGYGRQKLHYLPEAHTDFVLSVIAEELGLAGVALVLIAFAVLFGAGLRIALKAEARFASLVAFGMTLLIVVPALVNAAVVMGVLPTKGLSLPFLSYGRSSLVVSCAAVGVIWRIARIGGRVNRGHVVTSGLA